MDWEIEGRSRPRTLVMYDFRYRKTQSIIVIGSYLASSSIFMLMLEISCSVRKAATVDYPLL